MVAFYKHRYFKFIIAAMIIILVAVAVVINLNSYSDGIHEEAQKAFNIVDTAYKQNRAITNYEKNELNTFENLKSDRVEKYNKGIASKKEEKDAVLLYAVGRVIDMYEQGKSGSADFNDKYNQAKILLQWAINPSYRRVFFYKIFYKSID